MNLMMKDGVVKLPIIIRTNEDMAINFNMTPMGEAMFFIATKEYADKSNLTKTKGTKIINDKNIACYNIEFHKDAKETSKQLDSFSEAMLRETLRDLWDQYKQDPNVNPILLLTNWSLLSQQQPSTILNLLVNYFLRDPITYINICKSFI